MPRPIISIDEDKCNGCGQCILDCAEGALAIVDGKAKLISEIYCDGLGACLNCPRGALTLDVRDAPPFDEKAALEAKKQREGAGHGKFDRTDSGKPTPFGKGNPEIKDLGRANPFAKDESSPANLRTWPIQLELVPPNAAFLRKAPLLLAAHCAGFAMRDIGERLENKIPLICCPKLENRDLLAEKLAAIIKNNNTPEINILRMSVPCCSLPEIAEKAIREAGLAPKAHTHIVKLG